MITKDYINQLDTMYPSEAQLVVDDTYNVPAHATAYGVVKTGRIRWQTRDGLQEAFAGFAFSIPGTQKIDVMGEVAFFVRHGYKAPTATVKLEHKGRLTYIDGCSDSMLIQPMRMGDPVLNLLYFPKGIDQTFHTHPSIRLGLVLSGEGMASLPDKEIALKPGVLFCLEEQELHRFRTVTDEMRIVAYHPDSDWGPTDQNHPMLNRTYLDKK